MAASVEPLEHKPDILNSDFASHWQNLQYGRLCQNTQNSAPMIYPSPVMVPPMYLQGCFPWDGSGRPVSTTTNLFTRLMSYGSSTVPVAPLQSASNRPAGVYQHYVDENAQISRWYGDLLAESKGRSSRPACYKYEKGKSQLQKK
ncbi:PAP/OAS1 SUBSTRATE-BINDING DOMAIN SUPERFAMILY [Salix purpurea]|uniref:PAP/OAS1 SUBSTRATE-BINDING DOMAIN SUPERFAMILY n=1 Tax=Salix purpurea TaxID=77065 RepID=A0A9Q0SQX2_SALPP|nr:PAP/OAS1 SUBSTRATE-BINDING DOMAIN SUPERFAMILY [Salix purpurea]